MATSNPYENFLIQHLDFAIEYISLHYPFTAEQVKEYMPCLIKGDAYYPVYIQDCEQICRPRFGLSFNQNVEWTDALRELWQTGIWEPFIGEYRGAGDIPLNVHDVISELDSLMYQQAYSFYNGEDNFADMVTPTPNWLLQMVEYQTLSPEEVATLYERSSMEVFINPSIWQNTFHEVLTKDMVELLIQANKERMAQKEPKELEYDVDLPPITPEEEAALHSIILPTQPNEMHVTSYAGEQLIRIDDTDKHKAIAAIEKELEEAGLSFDFELEEAHPTPSVYNPNIPFSEEAKRIMVALGFIDEESEHEDDYFSKEQHSKYNGYNDWPDQAIDEAFEGDPEATWNVD